MIAPIVCLVLGTLAGMYVLPSESAALLGKFITPALAVVAFFAGFDAGCSGALHKLKRYRGRVLLLPLATAIGTIGAGILVGWLFGIPAGEAAAASAGFAYYSVSVGVLTELGGPWLGALTLVTNIIREALAFLLIPLVAKKFSPLAAMSIGGATSMDTTLPVIAACCSEEVVVMAMVHGIVLTLAVPVLAPLLYQFL